MSRTVPFPFVYRPKGAGANAGLQEDLGGLDLPVVARVPLVPRPLQKNSTHKTDHPTEVRWTNIMYRQQMKVKSKSAI